MSERRPPLRGSVWHPSAEMPSHPALGRDVEADVCVMGGGITGLTAALLLAREGREVVLIERHRLGSGVTGRTTAHVTTLIDAGYANLAEQLGLTTVRAVHASTSAAIEQIARLVRELDADCDFERVDACFYAEPGDDAAPVHGSHDALRAANVEAPGRIETSNGLPFPTADTLVVPDQAQFHPLRYLAALARAASDAGVRIFEATRAHHVRDGTPCEVETGGGHRVRAQHLVHATHTPAGISVLQVEMKNSRSYVLALRTRSEVPPGLFFDTAEPYRYVRRQTIAGEPLVLVGGGDHETGKGEPGEALRSLEAYARERFEDVEVVARWSSQVYAPSDGLPYIGWSPAGPHSIVATGFDGDGMVFGTLSAMIGTNLIVRDSDRWADLYRPDRFHVKASTRRVLEKGLSVAKNFVVDRLRVDSRAVADVPPGEARLLQLKGRRLAVFRDEDGEVHVRSAVCPHMKCIVHWNAFERSWDCSCHGSRFDVDGTVVEGPSLHDLHEVRLDGDEP